MQADIEKVPAEKQIKGCNSSDSSNPEANVSPVVAGENSPLQADTTPSSSEKSPSDTFYEKLCKLFESSGLSLLFNFRETSLDLYLFYKEVTERGGFYQVTKDVKWGEVASTLKLKSSVSMLPIQLQKIYAYLLYQFEQTYFYRTPVKPLKAPAKRKHGDSSDSTTIHFAFEDGPMEKRKCNNNTCQLSTEPGTAEQKSPLQTSSKNKEMKKEADAPLRPRTAYQIFLRKECIRLKEIHGETSASQNIRNMAIDVWRCLSETDRQPYIEESKKDKERFNREMTAYKERTNLQNAEAQKMPSSSKPNENNHTISFQVGGDDYHVTLPPNAENLLVADESMVDLAVRMMKNAPPDDPILQVNWDGYCGSLDLPS